MKNIVLDEALRSKFGELTEEVQISDESGKMVGMVVPKAMFYRLLLESPEAQVSEEELERSFAEPGGQPLVDVKRRLGMG
jgi:hypothetical protein